MEQLKALTGVEIKDADQGLIQACFATLNVIDKDNDVTVKGAFEDGAAVRISAYGHASWGHSLPVGKGVIRELGDQAILDGKFFLDTTHGRDTFNTLKELGELQQWSYGYDAIDSEMGTHDGKSVQFLKQLKVHEVSPVMIGAGVDTRTLATKDGMYVPLVTGTISGTSSTFPITTAVKTTPAFSDQTETVLGDVLSLIGRAKAFGSNGTDEERKVGRTLSAANRDRLAALMAALREADIEIEELLADTDPNKSRDLLLTEFLRYQQAIAQI